MTVILVALLGVCISSGAQATGNTDRTDPAHHDFRILIDVSGSMKNNDPQNLRRSALRLITELLPDGSKAGVWTFGAYVNMLVPYGTVDETWKTEARQATREINSLGLYTNIEETLKASSWDWNKPEPGYQRDVILLTDGLVDISSDQAQNRSSRYRILNEVLPRLQQSHSAIYTIALSANADTDLLKQLASASSGWHETVASADELERVFFRMFERAAPPETLPLVDNAVLVDKSATEITFLIFRKPGSAAATIITPSNNEFGRDALPDNVKWHAEKNYDLVTVSGPETGTWHINADVDPDNRVMVVTNLKLVTSTMPGSLLASDTTKVDIHLEDKGKTITKQAFLNFINVTVNQTGQDGQKWQWHLLDDGMRDDAAPNDGIYSHRFSDTLKPGQNTVVLQIDGTTFKRERRQFFTVYEQAAIAHIGQLPEGQPELQVIPIPELVDEQGLAMNATITSAGKEKSLPLTRSESGAWHLPLADYEKNGPAQIEISLAGKRPDGRTIESRIGPLSFGNPPPPEPAMKSETTGSPVEAAVTKPAPAVEPKGKNVAATPRVYQKPSWAFVISQVVLFNVLAGFALFAAYKKWIRKQQDAPNPLEELDHA